ncbi:hypothetical protein XANCAGTX0491_001796 [Xanthoria calcicola]
MAHNVYRPLTSVDRLRIKQQDNDETTSPGGKRHFDQISSVGPGSYRDGSVPSFQKASTVAPSERHQSRIESGRLTASTIGNTIDTCTQAGNAIAPSQKPQLSWNPTSSLNPLLNLSHSRYGLPEPLVQNFASRGIKYIYPWQSSCLLGRGLLTGEKNLVYTAPTGGGKSLVADVLMLKRVLENPRTKAILVLPYVALVQEKVNWLRRAVDGVSKEVEMSSQIPEAKRSKWPASRSVRIVGFFGGSKSRASWADVDIAVCTFEKANLLVNTAIEQCTIDDLGVVVLDELHMIDDDHRGYLMELLATKLLSLERSVQIVGMSATLPNTQLLAKWLDAKFYESKFKPIAIDEYLVCDNLIYPTSTSSAFFRAATQTCGVDSSQLSTPCRTIHTSAHKELHNPVKNAVVALAIETASEGYGALIFCGGRQACQSTALLVSKAMPCVDEVILAKRQDVIDDLRSTLVGLDAALEQTIPRGVGFHHAGLTSEEREILARAYDSRTLGVIVATCSLAAGINLPARRVILQGVRMGINPIGPAMLRQMRGRAGRKGKDEVGESFLCCQPSELDEVMQLLKADLPRVESSMKPEKRGIKRALLEVLTVRLATHRSAIDEYIRRTLLYHSMDKEMLSRWVEDTMEELQSLGQVKVDATGSYEATPLARATVGSGMTPEDGVFVQDELQRALRAFVMDGEMHVFYMFTPINIWGISEINWRIFRNEIERLDESGMRVLAFVGISPAFVNRMANSGKQLPEEDEEQRRTARVYRRFYAAFQLRDLCHEIPIPTVARKFETARGLVQTLAQTCEGFAAGMIQFCETMGWGMLKSVLEHMSDRLKAGARADLLDLARIPFVKSRTARVFWENGMRSLRAVAEAEAKDLVPLLLLAQPKRYNVEKAEDERYQQKLLLRCEVIVEAASRLWCKHGPLRIDRLEQLICQQRKSKSWTLKAICEARGHHDRIEMDSQAGGPHLPFATGVQAKARWG